MYYLNKIVGGFLNPLGIGLLLLVASLICVILKRRRPASSTPRFLTPNPSVLTPTLCFLLSFFWLWGWSTGAMGRWIGLSLEREFPPQLAERMPAADAIVVLGGGVGIETNACPYAELFPAADRAWHGARLYKAGKAQKVFVTCEADALFMEDLGVPREAITVNGKARNTEEEARLIADAMSQVKVKGQGQERTVKILLVTSAWHMRRAKLMYEKYAKDVEVIPAATDYMNMTMFGRPLEFKDFVPDPCLIGQNAYMFKEWLAYYGYYFLRK